VKYREKRLWSFTRTFISVVFNSPATAKRLAPNFLAGVLGMRWTSKPDVKAALFELQTWLSKPFMTQQAEPPREDRRDAGARRRGIYPEARGTEGFVTKVSADWLSMAEAGISLTASAPVRDRAAEVGAHHR
jgi:hypothetical protein